MILLASILLVAALLASFLFLTSIERTRGARILAPMRARLDVYVAAAAHAFRKMHAGGLSKRLKVIGAYLVHEFVHGVLVAVRALERLLTQTVRALRHQAAAHGETNGKVE